MDGSEYGEYGGWGKVVGIGSHVIDEFGNDLVEYECNEYSDSDNGHVWNVGREYVSPVDHSVCLFCFVLVCCCCVFVNSKVN